MKMKWRKKIIYLLVCLLVFATGAAESIEEAKAQRGTISGRLLRTSYDFIFLNYDNTVSAKDVIQNTYSREELESFSCDLARRISFRSAGPSGSDSTGMYEFTQAYEPECLRCMGEYCYCVLRLDDGTYAFVVFRHTKERNVAYLYTVLQNRLTTQELLSRMQHEYFGGDPNFSYITQRRYRGTAEEDLYLNEWLLDGHWCVRDEVEKEIIYTFYCLDGYLEIHEGKSYIQEPEQYKQKTAVIYSYDNQAAVRYGQFLEIDMSDIFQERGDNFSDICKSEIPDKGMIQGRYRIRTYSNMSVSYDNTVDPREVITKKYSRKELKTFINQLERNARIGEADMGDLAERYDIECVRNLNDHCYVILHLNDDTYAFISFSNSGSLTYMGADLQTKSSVEKLSEMLLGQDGSVNMAPITDEYYVGFPDFYIYQYERFKEDYWGTFGANNYYTSYTFYCTNGIVSVRKMIQSMVRLN